MPSPAEILASKKTRQREPRNKLAVTRKITWDCRARAERDRLRLSVRDVAKAVGLSQSSYWIIEQGGDLVLSNAVKIAEFFGADVAELWKRPTSTKGEK